MEVNLKKPDREFDHKVGSLCFWFDEMLAIIRWPAGNEMVLRLCLCPISGYLMMLRTPIGWDIFPSGSNVDLAYKNHQIEKMLLRG